MQYNQPYGISDPNAAYINGDPTTGTMGSIPPAASIEFDQREIVALISAAGLAPDNADLTQLLKSIKFIDVMNVFKHGANGGTASQWSMACPTFPTMPPPTGTSLWFKPGFSSVPGGTVFSVNGSAFAPVICVDGSPIAVGDIVPTAWVLLFFDGASWQVVAGSTRQFGALPILQAATNWYVDAANGHDTNYDGTSATVVGGTKHGPFRSLQRAADELPKYNMNGYNQSVHVANGAYQNVFCHPLNGSGTAAWIGNNAAPQNCSVSCSTQDTSAINCAGLQGSSYLFTGFRLSATGPGSSDGLAVSGGVAQIGVMQFGPCTRFHFDALNSGHIVFSGGPTNGLITIEPGATCQVHLFCETNSSIMVDTTPGYFPNLNIQGSVNIGTFAQSLGAGYIQVLYQPSITGKANVHGKMYDASANGIIYTFASGTNYFPGDAPGTVSYGGQYVP